MRVAISGASGLVGSALTTSLTAAGDDVLPMVRFGSDGVRWDPLHGTVDTAALAGTDAVVHLAGENIAAARWSPAVKTRIRESRIEGTRTLAAALASMERPPKVMISASAVGFYGDRGEEELTEKSRGGHDFMAQVAADWERAAEPAREAGLRVVHLRIGVVLSARGGALAKMLTPFKLGLGGVIGTGRQYLSWITMDDLLAVIRHVLDDESLSGAVNAVAPNPVTNHEFTKSLGRVLGRPTIFPMPASGARLLFGEVADALLLVGQRVLPIRLIESDFEFRYPGLEDALRHELGR